MKTQPLLESFLSHFTRAIRQEMEAMRERMGTFELLLDEGRRLEKDDATPGTRLSFRLATSDSRIVVGLECSLRLSGTEDLVRVVEIDEGRIILESPRDINPGNGLGALVFYPWFLYERLLQMLAGINDSDYYVERAMALFGKIKPKRGKVDLLREHRELNESQRKAVRLCRESDLAFVWGPPGTGKTTTLAHIVDESAASGQRILLLSTTNTAVDQALAKSLREPFITGEVAAGRVIRIGRSDAPSSETGLRDVVARLHRELGERLESLITRRAEIDGALAACKTASELLGEPDGPIQQSLFSEEKPANQLVSLEGIFSPARIESLIQVPSRRLAAMMRRRQSRLATLRRLYSERITDCRKSLQGREQTVVNGARIIATTLTNAYFSPLLDGQRFDAVIVEEASMAILPTLFFAACLARERTIMVGDPCQLPAIIQSDADYVRQVMGRNIFEVTVPEPLKSKIVAFLDVQYRMHPVIGKMVSECFYDGKLEHAARPAECAAIAAFEPFPLAPLVVLDLAGGGACERGAGGQSRQNETSARVSLDLATRALRSGAKTVAIITPYVDQVRAIRKKMKEKGLDDERLECSTVHRFQGSERDVVILDTVDAEPMAPGILLNEAGQGSNARKLINVGLSRARGKLVIIADVEYFRRRAPDGILTQVIGRAIELGRLVRYERKG